MQNATASLLISSGLCALTALVSSQLTTYYLRGQTVRVAVSGSVHQTDHLPFDWRRYESPEYPEFWDDGDGAPPRPFRYVAAHPTRENAKKLISWIKLQQETIAKVTLLLGEDAKVLLAAIEPSSNQPKSIDLMQKPDPKLRFAKDSPLSWNDIYLVHIYRSGCSACQKSTPVIEKLRRQGAHIITLQTDFKKLAPLHPDSKPYNRAFAEAFPHEVTPTIYLKVKGHEVQRLDGFMSADDLFSHINQQFGETP